MTSKSHKTDCKDNNTVDIPTSIITYNGSSNGQVKEATETVPSAPVVGGAVEESEKLINVNAVTGLKLQSLIKFPVSIGNLNNLTIMVDSGCHTSLIRESIVEKLNLTIDPNRKLLLKGVGTDNIQHGLGSVICTIYIHGIQITQFMFNVIRDAGKQYDFLV